MKTFDLAIIGAGPCGYTAAERAAVLGLSVVLFEQKTVGGVCLNEGCIPTKALLYSAKVYETAVNGSKYGVTTEGVAVDYRKMVERKNRVVRRLVGGVSARMKAHGVEVVTGHAYIEGRTDEGFVVTSGSESYRAKSLLIATGSRTAVPAIPGIETAGDRVVTHRELLTLTERPERLVVIGGGVIGMEFASLFHTLGAQVTVIEMLDKILGPMDRELSELLQESYAKRGMAFHLRSAVTEIDGERVVFRTPEGELHTAQGDKILLSVGRKRNTEGFGLENIGVELDGDRIRVNGQMQTNVPGVYAAGDVAGEFLLAHTAIREAEVVINHLTGQSDRMSYTAVPAVVYTNPEMASVGLTEALAGAQGIAFQTRKLPMTYSGRFMAENEGVNGLCKVLIDPDSEQVLGVHLLGNPAGELISTAALAIERNLTVNELQKLIFPHPTVSEILKETLFEL